MARCGALNHPALKGTPPRREIQSMRLQCNSLQAQSSFADMQQRILGGVTVRPVIKALRNRCQNIETVLSSYVCVSRINNKY